MNLAKSICIVLLILPIITVVNAHAVGVTVGPDGKARTSVLQLPFAFYNQSFGAAVGYVYGVHGWPQKQSTLLTATIGGTTGSAMSFLIGKDLQVPFTQRWFLDPVVSVGYFNDSETYASGNPDYLDERAGSNDSDEDNYVEGSGWDNFARFKFKYLIPMGHGKDTIISTYKVSGGHLIEGATGGESMNPFVSGITFLEFRPFSRSQEVNGDDVDAKIRTNGLDTSIYWDNRDFFANPKRGNSWRMKYSQDWGKFNSSGEWTSMEGEVDQYFDNCTAIYLILAIVPLVAVFTTMSNSDYMSITRDSLILINISRLVQSGFIASLGFIKKPLYHWLVVIGLLIAFFGSELTFVFKLEF